MAVSDMAQEEYKGSRTLSKKKFYELQDAFTSRLGTEQGSIALEVVKETLKFDPNVSVYTETMKRGIVERRERLKKEGISTYVSSGAKSFYDKQKVKST